MKQEQIEEWTENPVTEQLLKHVARELLDTAETSVIDCYVPGNPQQTQENVVDLTARFNVWDTVREILEGDWSYFMEEDSEDRDIPVGE